MKLQSIFRCILYCSIGSGLHAQVLPGAWDSFSNEHPAKEWGVWDSFYNTAWLPGWGSSIYAEAEHPEVVRWAAPGESSIWFFADQEVASGAFVGDYSAAGIEAIEADVGLAYPTSQFNVGVFVANGPAGEGWYFSRPFPAAEGAPAGMTTISVRLDESWSYRAATGWVFFLPDSNFWSSVEELAFRFTPSSGVLNSYAELDNVRLIPKVQAPQVFSLVNNDVYRFSFEGRPGLKYQLSRFAGVSWSSVEMPQFLGEGSHAHSVTTNFAVEFFRLGVEPMYTDVSFLE